MRDGSTETSPSYLKNMDWKVRIMISRDQPKMLHSQRLASSSRTVLSWRLFTTNLTPRVPSPTLLLSTILLEIPFITTTLPKKMRGNKFLRLTSSRGGRKDSSLSDREITRCYLLKSNPTPCT